MYKLALTNDRKKVVRTGVGTEMARLLEAQSGVLRKATMNVLCATACKLKSPTNYSDAFCAISRNNESPCFGEFCESARLTCQPISLSAVVMRLIANIPSYLDLGDGGGPLIDRNGKLVGLYMPDMVGKYVDNVNTLVDPIRCPHHKAFHLSRSLRPAFQAWVLTSDAIAI